MTDEKVFCKNCKHYESFWYMGYGADECEAEGNRKYSENWEGRFYRLIRHPKKINRFNDCRWFDRKDKK